MVDKFEKGKWYQWTGNDPEKQIIGHLDCAKRSSNCTHCIPEFCNYKHIINHDPIECIDPDTHRFKIHKHGSAFNATDPTTNSLYHWHHVEHNIDTLPDTFEIWVGDDGQLWDRLIELFKGAGYTGSYDYFDRVEHNYIYYKGTGIHAFSYTMYNPKLLASSVVDYLEKKVGQTAAPTTHKFKVGMWVKDHAGDYGVITSCDNLPDSEVDVYYYAPFSIL